MADYAGVATHVREMKELPMYRENSRVSTVLSMLIAFQVFSLLDDRLDNAREEERIRGITQVYRDAQYWQSEHFGQLMARSQDREIFYQEQYEILAGKRDPSPAVPDRFDQVLTAQQEIY